MQKSLLPGEVDEHLLSESVSERKRQDKSFVDRLQTRLRYQSKTSAIPPSGAELHRGKVFIDHGVTLPDTWQATLARTESMITDEPYAATIFVADNPGSPNFSVVTLAAALAGRWVLSPAALVSGQGASIKYLATVFTKRLVWASASFRALYPREWLTILEIVDKSGRPWFFFVFCRRVGKLQSYCYEQGSTCGCNCFGWS